MKQKNKIKFSLDKILILYNLHGNQKTRKINKNLIKEEK